MNITVVEARGLKALDFDNTSDPYCIIEVEDKFNQTAYIPKTLNPIWKETFQFPILRGNDSIIKVTVKDYDVIG